jgi:hypothetical protein
MRDQEEGCVGTRRVWSLGDDADDICHAGVNASHINSGKYF